jgi:hypothetical protein
MTAVRGLLVAAGFALVGAVILDQATGIVSKAILTRDARACALESYGTDRAIAQCYTERNLDPPVNFDARLDYEVIRQ